MRAGIQAVLLLVATMCSFAGTAQAAAILYTFTGNLNGTINGSEFTLAPTTFTLISDTDLVFQPRPAVRPSLFTTPFTTLNFTIDGTAGSFASTYQAFSITVAGNGLVGFTEFDGNDIIDVNDDGLIGYDLKSAIGPVADAPLDFLNFDTPLQTSAGELVLFDDDDASVRFTATLLAGAAPEPGTWALLIAGFALVGAALRRRGSIAVAA